MSYYNKWTSSYELDKTDANYYKYLKYKKKYLDLTNQFAGGMGTARNLFNQTLGSIKNKQLYDNFSKNIMNDINSGGLDIKISDMNIANKEFDQIFDQIYDYLLKNHYNNNKQLLEKTIDFIIYSYIYGTFGSPNSFQNMDEFKILIEAYNLLENRNLNTKKKDDIKKTHGLLGLKQYIDMNADILTRLKQQIEKDKRRDMIRRDIAKEGPMEPIYETDTVHIYSPNTEKQSQYYGQGTKWCTASLDHNTDFDSHHSLGPLYIIILKANKSIKVQLQLESQSLMDVEDYPLTFTKMLELFNNDIKLSEWLDEKYKEYYLKIFKVEKIDKEARLIRLNQDRNLYDSYPKTEKLDDLVLEYYRKLSPEQLPDHLNLNSDDKTLKILQRLSPNVLNNIKYVWYINGDNNILNMLNNDKNRQDAIDSIKKELLKFTSIYTLLPNLVDLSLISFYFLHTVSKTNFNKVYESTLINLFDAISHLKNFCTLRFFENIPQETINKINHNFKIMIGYFMIP
jgi:hypothetical protein